MRSSCAWCGGPGQHVFWSDASKARAISRCDDCGGNFNGPGFWVGISAATGSDVDPHATHSHGHGKCVDPRQLELLS
jgi:hypothetical protein